MNMSGVLDGIRVLDMSRFIAGPYCGMCLADMGAEVIKIEKAGDVGDSTRTLGPWKNGKSLYFPAYNRNKKSVTVNYRSKEGIRVLKDLICNSDVLIENFRPGILQSMGLGYDVLKQINPRIILVSVSGFGQEGPYKDRPAFDGIISTMAGMARSVNGSEPITGNGAISDTMTAMNAFSGVLLALIDRERTGVGQHVDIAMLDTAVILQNTDIAGWAINRQEPKFGADSAPYGVFRTKDGWVNINAARYTMFEKLQKLIGDPELCKEEYVKMPPRVRDREKICAIIEKWTMQHTADEIEEILAREEVPAAAVATPERILRNPHLRAIHQIVDVEVNGVGPVPYAGCPIHLSAHRDIPYERAPELGEHNDEVLGNVLGYSAEHIAELKDKKFI